MKDLLISGSRFLTTDDVADAVLHYAQVLAQYGRADVVRFPALVDGVAANSWLTLGSGAAIAAVEVLDSPIERLAGAHEASAEIQRRSASLEGM
ncbi:hypothetical protein G5T42_13935 [Microbacterium sp. 4R-513]|uniref:hypothetical protein n=1 Tax=Microbacterium sp. 4R-513 TaxID=2567934 RepID=UPI0013E1138C|nr:hypothetical protein [Microbacterium sp. 4R-513]QIG40438.1 hypothetical protein G5T42_13935 [Microbacterium sp. 4R-513]